MATKFLPTVPPFVPGQGMAELVKHLQLTVKSDRVTFAGSTNITLFEVPGNILITGVKVNVTTAFDGTGASAAATATIEVPGSTGAIVVWDAAGTKLQALTTEAMSPDTMAGAVLVPSSGGVITFKQEPGTTTAGVAEVYVEYVPNATLL
jgi:hypothetical protein